MSLSEIITLPSLRKKLEDAGYQSLEEIKKESVYDLAQELQLTKEEVKSLIKISDKETKLKRTFGELLTAEKEYSISTSSKSFDKLLGDGVPPFKITEVCGESGSGKSQICMQLAVNVQLPKEEGGASGECIYIDTEGSFESSRIVSMASKYDVEKILKGIHLFRVHDHAELMALIRQLPDILKEYPNTRLIVIDSIAYHFRLNTLDSRTRSIILDYIAQSLIEVAHINTLAVIVSNHVTTDGMDMTWTPSLGSSWGYWCAKRLFVSRKREFRYGYLYKSVENAGSRPVQFCIRDEGITDPEEDEIGMAKSENELQAEISNKIDSTWEEMKHIQIKEEDQFDDFWNEDVIPQLPNETTPIKNDTKDHALVSKAPLEATIVQEDLSNSSQMNMSSISSLSSEEDMLDDELNRQDVTALNDVNMSSTKDSDESNLNEKRLRDASLLDDTASKKAKYDDTPNILNANISGDADQRQLVSTNTEEKMQSQEEIGDLLEMTSSSETQGNDFMYATQSEEEIDLDFVNNVQSYF